MEIVKVKGEQNRFFYKDVKMSFRIDIIDFLKITLPEGEIFGQLRRLPKTGDIKSVFYKECNIYGKRLIPFPRSIGSPVRFLPREFAGDVLLRTDSTVENVVLKFALEGDRVIPLNEWLALAKERHDRFIELATTGMGLADLVESDELNELLATCHIDYI